MSLRAEQNNMWFYTRRVAFLAAALLIICMGTFIWAGPAQAASASVVFKGSSDRKQIALTFDDNGITDRAVAILRTLQKHNVPATLFLIGSAVKGTPAINAEILKGMKSGLFEVGDHSWSHPQLPKLSTAGMASEIGGGTDAFRAVTGARTVPLFRPPYGATNSQVAAVAGSRGSDSKGLVSTNTGKRSPSFLNAKSAVHRGVV